MALLLFDDFPVAEDLGGVFGALFAEDMRVAANHLLIDFADDIGDGEARFFASDLGVEEDLEEEIAEFFCEFGVIMAFQRVEDFVGLFDQVGAKRGVRLFAVPRTATGSTEPRHDGHKLVEGGADPGGREGGAGLAAGFDGTTGTFATVRLACHVVGITLTGFDLACRGGRAVASRR